MAGIDSLIYSDFPGETRIALLQDDQIVEILIDRGQAAAGNILLGRVIAVPKTANAAFIDIGEREPGFLSSPGKLKEGDKIVVQVTASARRGKGAALSSRFDPPEPFETGSLTPPAILRAPSLLQRCRSAYPDIDTVLVSESASLPAAKHFFPGARLETGCFESSGAADALEQALTAELALPGGGRLIIEEMAAITAIDIDSGGRPATEANLAAMPVIAAQIRLRALAGHILIDVIPTKNRRSFSEMMDLLRQKLADDPNPARLVGVTPLGMLELTRTRKRPSLAETMLDAPQCQLSAETMGLAGLRALLSAVYQRPSVFPTLAAAPDIIAALRRRPAVLAAMTERLGRPPLLRSQAGLTTFELIEDSP